MWGVIGTWYFADNPVREAAKMLAEGANAMDALIKLATMIEDDPTVDAVGYGGFLNSNGELELDAAIMDGESMNLGCVAGIKNIKNPILVARDILLKSRHNLFVGEGANAYAAELGYECIDMVSPEARAKWQALVEKNELDPIGHDTVGVVTLDMNGKMFAGTSTSGAGMKKPGRVGDSPLVGSGYYVDNDCGGAAATGWGEDIMKCCTSYAAVEFMRAGCTAQEAAEKAVAQTHNRLLRTDDNPGNIAVICMDKYGRFGGAANHEGFQFAAASETCPPALYDVKPLVLRRSSNSHLETINNIF